MATQSTPVEDGPGSYRFTFSSKRGELSGRVTVGIEGPPDKRSHGGGRRAAKNQILALSREFAEACGDELVTYLEVDEGVRYESAQVGRFYASSRYFLARSAEGGVA